MNEEEEDWDYGDISLMRQRGEELEWQVPLVICIMGKNNKDNMHKGGSNKIVKIEVSLMMIAMLDGDHDRYE